MASILFEIMNIMEAKRIPFRIERNSKFGVTLDAMMIGRRIEITVDEDDMVDVAVFRGDEQVEVGIEAVKKALEYDD